ncbi:MAG: dihydroorotate dehydrogenase electron transfer subunit [Solirubrobacterales bacterium]|nr:dihydroorotate dehydrogenase electron transfer subunit [Solirubrobacterales bacterium]
MSVHQSGADPHSAIPRGEDGRTLAPFGRRRALVVSTRTVGSYVLLELADRDGPPADPGQFHMLATQQHWGAGEDERPFLPRAFSPMGSSGGHLWFMLEDVGPGTHRLATLKKGEALWVSGPFGRGFHSPETVHVEARSVSGDDPALGDRGGPRPILVAGGIGLPPIIDWSRRLTEQGTEATMLLGFRDAAHAQVAASFATAQLATDDGSAGHHGYVTELLAAELDRDQHAVVYACGPGPMLEAVRRLVSERDVPTELALEAGMACGYGACFGCVVPLKDGGYARVCVDGPVMAAGDLAPVPAH